MPETRVWTVRQQDLPKVLQGLKNLPIDTLLGEPRVVETSEEEAAGIPVPERVLWVHSHREVSKKTGSFFNVGDLILYGKYKNKKGRIIRFLANDKGQPLVEIEPIPKGRKKNKVMGLFKIWNVAVLEKAQQEKAKTARRVGDRFIFQASKTYQVRDPMDPIAQRVASRFVLATNIPLGETVEVGKVRIHRYRDHFKVTDLTFAGKRGKKVRVMSLSPSYSFKGDRDGWMESMSKAIPDYDSYDGIKRFISDVLVDYPGEITIRESEERGIDVNPMGTRKIRLMSTEGVEITAEPKEFLVKSTVDMAGPPGKPSFKQDTLYYSTSKTDAQVFYNWLSANEAEAKRMSIADLRKLWDEMRIGYDYH